MKKATKIIKDTDGAIKIPVYLSWGDIAFLQSTIRRSKLTDDKNLLGELQYREHEIIVHLNKNKST